MSPLEQEKLPYYDLDNIGKAHYFLEFSSEGKLKSDSTISIDFELIAHQILLLEKAAKSNGLKIKKIIFKIELKEKLYDGHYGKILKHSDIYITKSLSPLINSLHDDHFHIDFEFSK